MALNTKKKRLTTIMVFLKREKTDGETVVERLAVTLRDFDKSILVVSPVEASANKNKESPTEFLVTKVDAYLPGPVIVCYATQCTCACAHMSCPSACLIHK